MFKTNRQQDEANEAAIADGERRYAFSLEAYENSLDPYEAPCSHANTKRLTGQATPGTFTPGRRPGLGGQVG
jgi:hypothetical protein